MAQRFAQTILSVLSATLWRIKIMPTNAQRFGTRNLTANLPVDYIMELGKAAFARFDGNRTRLVAQFIEDGAAKHDPQLAERLRSIRKEFYKQGISMERAVKAAAILLL